MKPSQNKSISLKALVVGLFASLSATVATHGQVVTNNFTNPNLDFVTNGIIGSGFGGVDLNSSDIPHGSGGGNTLAADTGSVLGLPGAGFLFVQNPVGGFAGAEDDGFFCFDVVWGDFDAYVDVTAPFTAGAYTFGGLLARAVSDGTGQPYNPTGTNASENWVNITRFEEFSIPTQVRYASNAVDNQITVTNLFGPVDSTNADVFLRLNRTGDVFSFYDSSTYGGPWTLERTITRTDLHGAAMQVGIEEGSFGGGSSPVITFSDFGIHGTNTISSPAGDPASLLVTSPNTNGSVTLSWKPATGTDGSIVVMTENQPITQSPYYGFSYVGSNVFGSVINMGGNQQVVYAGSGTNVTVSGLFGANDTYNVAVYSYTTNHGTSLITYDSNPATNTCPGPGVIVSITATLNIPSIPVNGVATVSVLANYSSGGTLNVSGSSTATSSDPAINASVQTANGVGIIVLGATNVTAGNTNGNVTVSYSTFSTSIDVVSHTPVFTDNFNVPHSYMSNGVEGTAWDGVYQTSTDIANGVDPALLVVSNFDADITTNNCLSIASANSYWKGVDDNGPYLYKIAPNDFQSSVHITAYNHVAYNFVGLMARAYASSNNASPFGTAQREDNVNWQRFDQFGDTTVLFNTINGTTAETDDKDGDTTDFWLLMTRVNATNFYLYKSATFGGPWTLVHSVVQPALVSGTPVQVGLEQGSYGGAMGTVQFDTFMLDGSNIVGSAYTASVVPTPATNVTVTLTTGDTAANITWVQGVVPPSTAPTSFVVMRAGSPVSSQPYFGETTTANPIFGAGTDLGGGNFVVFRAVGSNVTVTGLTPGIQYYVVVYEYSGSSTTKAFSYATSNSIAVTPTVVFTGVTAQVSSVAVPVNGIGGSYHVFASIQGTTNLIDVSSSATLIATNGIVTGAGGIFTGIKVGTDTNVTFSFTPGNSTNALVSGAFSVSARAPSYSDNFSKSNNYLALATAGSNAVAGTIWDGVFLGGAGGAPAGYSVPGGIDGGGQTTSLDANITTSNTLTLIHQNDTWDGGGAAGGPDDGFFIYKNVVGDFQCSVFVPSMQQVAYQMSGIMARLATPAGAPASGTNGVENFINQTEFEEFGYLDILRFDINSADDNFGTPPAVIPANNGFLMVRTQGTNFTFYRRSGPTNAFVGPIASYTENLPLFAYGTSNVVEVGISSATYNLPSSGLETTSFSQFMLDLSTGPSLSYTTAGGNLIITWDANGAFQHLYSTTNLANAFSVVSSATITTANGTSSVTVPIGKGNDYYKVGP